jgi:hypothetical protein
MAEGVRRPGPDRTFLFLLTPIAAASVPSLVYCLLVAALWAHGLVAGRQVELHLPPASGWDHVFAWQISVYAWVARWNSVATLGATGLFAFTLVWPRWRTWAGLALIPYGMLLCADFTLRWRYALMP